jgi:hypothetical protein
MEALARVWMRVALCVSLCLYGSDFSFAQAIHSTGDPVHIEAADLLRLAKFVEWPPQPPTRTLETFNFCILGKDPFGRSLDETVLGRSISERPTMIIRGSWLAEMGRCDVVFVSSSEQKHVPKILRDVQGKGILTVSQTTNFAASGGIVQFMRTSDGIGLAINVDAAKRAGLTIRAPLLALADIVRDEAAGSKN